MKLLLRTTRQVALTDAGVVFLEHSRRILAELDQAAAAARGVDSLHGLLRLVMSSAFATREVIPRLPAFLEQHPGLKIELILSDRTDDLIAERADVALRLGYVADSAFGARLLASAPRLVIASSAYLAERGVPRTLAELSRHDGIVGPGLLGRRGWAFGRSGAVTSVAVDGRVRVASSEGVMACVKAGLGIAVVSLWMCRAELERGEVRAVLSDHVLEPVEMHAVYPAGPHPGPKARAFSDYLAAKLG